MDHPIKAFISNLFGDSKPDDKKNHWAQALIDEEYDSVKDLKEMSNDDWSVISKDIPLTIIGEIRKKLNQDQDQNTTFSPEDK